MAVPSPPISISICSPSSPPPRSASASPPRRHLAVQPSYETCLRADSLLPSPCNMNEANTISTGGEGKKRKKTDGGMRRFEGQMNKLFAEGRRQGRRLGKLDRDGVRRFSREGLPLVSPGHFPREKGRKMRTDSAASLNRVSAGVLKS